MHSCMSKSSKYIFNFITLDIKKIYMHYQLTINIRQAIHLYRNKHPHVPAYSSIRLQALLCLNHFCAALKFLKNENYYTTIICITHLVQMQRLLKLYRGLQFLCVHFCVCCKHLQNHQSIQNAVSQEQRVHKDHQI